MMIVGIDEAGRGCWAGPLVAAAVILDRTIPGLTDSKMLTKNQREKLSVTIKQSAVACGVGWVYPKEIDEIGLTASTRKAMREALSQIAQPYDEVIIDGNYNYLCSCKDKPCNEGIETLIKADLLIPAVSAASIIAKVERDKYMAEIAAEYPLYEFERHVGYGTVVHHQLLKLHGVSDIHRLSYKPVRALLGE